MTMLRIECSGGRHAARVDYRHGAPDLPSGSSTSSSGYPTENRHSDVLARLSGMGGIQSV